MPKQNRNKVPDLRSVKRRKWSNGVNEAEGKNDFSESHRTANGDYQPAKRRDKTGKNGSRIAQLESNRWTATVPMRKDRPPQVDESKAWDPALARFISTGVRRLSP